LEKSEAVLRRKLVLAGIKSAENGSHRPVYASAVTLVGRFGKVNAGTFGAVAQRSPRPLEGEPVSFSGNLKISGIFAPPQRVHDVHRVIVQKMAG
jgi:hypothetical protein